MSNTAPELVSASMYLPFPVPPGNIPWTAVQGAGQCRAVGQHRHQLLGYLSCSTALDEGEEDPYPAEITFNKVRWEDKQRFQGEIISVSEI